MLYDPGDEDPTSIALIRAPENLLVTYAAGPAVFAFGRVWLAVVRLWTRHDWSAKRAP